MQKLLLTSAAAATALVASTAPTLASAQGWGVQHNGASVECRQRANNSGLVGGVAGAALGAIAGRSIAGRGVRSEGGLLGAVAGAVVGNQIGKRRVVCEEYSGPNGYHSSNAYGYQNYPNYQYQPRPAHNHQNSYHSSYSANQCGWGTTSVRGPDGRSYQQQVWMCRGQDGQWYPAQ